jgi:cytochrome P450 family 9
MFEFRYPSYFIRDPQLIKRLCVKEFEHFSEHREIIPTETDEILGKSLFFLKGQEWKEMRATMSPAFTGKI